MICKIDGQEVPLEHVIERDFGWGSQIAPGQSHKYELFIPTTEVPGILARPYNEFSAEMEADDNLAGEAVIGRMQKLGYPGFDRIFPHERRLLEVAVREYLYNDVFNAAFKNSPGRYRYALNSITSVEMLDQGLVIRGEAVKARPIPGVG